MRVEASQISQISQFRQLRTNRLPVPSARRSGLGARVLSCLALGLVVWAAPGCAPWTKPAPPKASSIPQGSEPLESSQAIQNAPVAQTLPASPGAPAGLYSQGPASPDGIGVFFQGREIAGVMGAAGAAWLDRPERLAEERPDLLLDLLGIEPGIVAADVGAGTGYLTFSLAERVGSDGKVFAVDIQPEMLARLTARQAELGVDNVVTVLGRLDSVGLEEESVDLAVLVDVYHEVSQPFEWTQTLVRALKPGGRLVLVEYRGEDAKLRILRLHKMTEEQVRREMGLQELRFVENQNALPTQHVLIFEKPAVLP